MPEGLTWSLFGKGCNNGAKIQTTKNYSSVGQLWFENFSWFRFQIMPKGYLTTCIFLVQYRPLCVSCHPFSRSWYYSTLGPDVPTSTHFWGLYTATAVVLLSLLIKGTRGHSLLLWPHCLRRQVNGVLYFWTNSRSLKTITDSQKVYT